MSRSTEYLGETIALASDYVQEAVRIFRMDQRLYLSEADPPGQHAEWVDSPRAPDRGQRQIDLPGLRALCSDEEKISVEEERDSGHKSRI